MDFLHPNTCTPLVWTYNRMAQNVNPMSRMFDIRVLLFKDDFVMHYLGYSRILVMRASMFEHEYGKTK